ncbi:MAG: hypothetical protein M3Q23_01495, partial [Actinomycetota bacterium]|nr:hypothetical protein [Actinomycetota bacterium]
MKARHRAAMAGAALAAAYVLATGAAGWLGLVAGRPLLDGFGPPPPYRWVSPPPALAAGNQPPAAGSFSVDLAADGSAAGVFSTPDLQATLILEKGAIASASGQRSVRLTIIPFDPASFDSPPRGMTIVGNAYRFQAVYRPDGNPVGRFAGPARIELAYPATAGTYRHRTLQSVRGTSWRALTTTDTGVQLQTISDVTSLGVFAVGQVGKPSSGSLVRSLPALVLTVLAVVASAWFAITAVRDRARRS